MRIVYLAVGFLFLALGVVGAFLPLLPTTIFLILAAGSFAKSSPKLESWLLNHPTFGPSIRRWRDTGAIAPQAKAIATAGMAAGYGLFLLSARPGLPLASLVAAILLGCALFVVSRPDG
jgi:uncharacterized membrane protein YbaN (DUF454 family)